jgi:hypothetical protein
MVASAEQPSQDGENQVPEQKQPSFAEVKEAISKMPKARSFFGVSIEKFSQNDLKRIITWQAVTSNQMKNQLEGRIKLMEEDQNAKSSTKSDAKKKTPSK